MSKLLDYAMSLPKRVVVVLAYLLIGCIGLVDYVTGHDLSVSAFYLIPIGWVAWVAGRRAGLVLATGGAVLWMVADIAVGYPYSHPVYLYSNALILLALYISAVYLLTGLRKTTALRAELAVRERVEQMRLQAERLATVGTMAAQVAHEVRNPLGSVTLNLDLIDKEIAALAESPGHSAEEGHLLVEEIRAEVRRIRHVVDDYLQFARLPKPKREPLTVNALLEQKLAFMSGALEQARVKLRTEFDPAPAAIHGDADLIWEATLNLIQNSLEAMPDGGELCVGTAREPRHILVRVADTGTGMEPERLAVIFRPFVTTKPQGTGLGLTLVQQIVTEHGGHVECASVKGRGTTFTIYLPRLENS